jgi:hypothetical protein
MRLKERYYLVIEHIGGHKRVLAVIQLGIANFGIGIYECLLINMSYAIDMFYIIGILSAKIIR